MSHDLDEQIAQFLQNHLDIKLSLFQLNSTQGKELLELLNIVIHAIAPEQPEKFGSESIEDIVDRLSEFLRIMKFDFPCEPEEWDRRMTNADPKIIHPALYFLLADFENMKKKAYLARFVEEVHVPEEIATETTVNELIIQHRELREQFEIVYNQSVQLGDTSVEHLRAQISDLKADKARLSTKIKAFQRKMQTVSNIDDLIKITGKLRSESEKEIKLQEQLSRLTEEKKLILHRQQVATDRIKAIRSQYEQRLQLLKKELNDIKNISNEKQNEDKNIILLQNQILQIKKIIDNKEIQLKDLKMKFEENEKNYQEKKAQGIIEIPAQAQFQKFISDLKTKNENYKQNMAIINAQNKELAVLLRTKSIVEEQHNSVFHDLEKIERSQGIHGFREARQKLEEVAATKADLDGNKSKTLEEMSTLVQQISNKIQSRQVELKPLVSSLQEKRKYKSEVESKFIAAKTRHNNAVTQFETDCMALDEENTKLRNEIFKYHSKIYQLNSLLSSVTRNNKRVSDEMKANETGNAVSKNYKTYSELFQKEQLNLKKKTQDLRDQKKSVSTQSVDNQKQLEAFSSLRALLQIKHQCQIDAVEKKKLIKKQQELESQNPEQIVVLE